MFEIGDRVVYIDDEDKIDGNTYSFETNPMFWHQMKLNKIYTISLIRENCYAIEEIPNIWIGDYRLISISEHRKQKLDKICSKLEIE